MSLPKARDGFGEFFREKYANLPQKSAEKYAIILHIFLILQFLNTLRRC